MSLPLQNYAHAKRKLDSLAKSFGDGERSEVSLRSQGRQEGDSQTSEKMLAFNQSITNIEQNEKMIHDKSNSLNRIKVLEQQLKSCKSRSSLWEKAKSEIISLNKYLKLSSISLDCSDIAIMKQFFQSISNLLLTKEGRSKDEKVKVEQNKKKEAELFQKLVESNKKKYELQQKIVQYEYEISKLNDINESLREKQRVQSTMRSSKIRQFHEETLITIQQKDDQFSNLEERHNDLKLQMVRYEETILALKNELESKERDLVETKDNNQQLYLECEARKRQIYELKQEDRENEMAFLTIRAELQKMIDENILFRTQLNKKKDQIQHLRSVIEDAKATNDQFIKEIQSALECQQFKRQEMLSLLLHREQMTNKGLTSNSRFAINRKKSKIAAHKLINSKSDRCLPSRIQK